MTECPKGIDAGHWGGVSLGILEVASISGEGYRDLYFQGSFCPHEDGSFRLIFEGSPSYGGSYYIFNSITSDSRTTPYHYLDSNTCYPYSIYQSIDYSDGNYGILYFQKMNEDKQIITSEYSLSCNRIICMKGSKHPLCVSFITCKHRQAHVKSGIISFFILIEQEIT